MVPAHHTWPQLPWASPDPSAAIEGPPPNLTYVAFADLPQTDQSQRIGPCHQRPQPSRLAGQVAERHQNIPSSCYILVYTVSVSPWHHHSPLPQHLKMCSPRSYVKTLQRSRDPPPAKQDGAHQGKLLETPQYTIKFCRTHGTVEVKGTYHRHPAFTDGESRGQQREWPTLRPLPCAVTEPGPDKTPDRQPVLTPLHPASCFRQLSLGAYMAAGRGESQVQITSISQGAKKEVETALPSRPQATCG